MPLLLVSEVAASGNHARDGAESVSHHVQGDDGQDASGRRSGPGDEQCRQVGADSGERSPCGLPKRRIDGDRCRREQ